MSQLTIEQAMRLALEHSRAGRASQAELIYRHILSVQPDCADALHELGVIVGQAGRVDEALGLIRRAIAASPGNAGYHCDLASFLQTGGRSDDAITVFQRAIALAPDFAEAHYNLAIAWKSKGDLDNAMACNQRAVALKPAFVEAHNNLGIIWKEKGQYDRAIACYRTAVELRPDYAEAHINLGVALRDTGQVDEAIACYQRVLALRPGNADAYNNLGTALRDKGQIDQAIACYQQAVAVRPDLLGANSNLGSACKAIGQLDRALACFRRELALHPNFVPADDNLLYTLLYHPGTDARAVFDESRRWNRQHAQPLARFVVGHSNNRDPDRRLRIGYVSADYFDHASALFLLPLFQHHDRERFEVTCYAQVSRGDACTRQLRQQVQRWRSTVGQSDAQVAAQVRSDQIDILVDLKLHSADNRLLVFAHKPAPVQVTWLGYPGTTGMDAIDYRLTDPYLDPPGTDESCYSERTIRLPDTFWCYDPLTGEPDVNALPRTGNGFITFGCLNNFCKVNDGVISLWAKVLKAVADSRLILMAPPGGARQAVLDRFGREDVAPDRIEFLAKQPRADYLRTYHRIDIALDTFPYNGHTTSLDALWMGVPVVTLVGKTVVGRAGLSQLTNLRLAELIARVPEEYVQIAAELAGDVRRLAELRSGLRLRMQTSPLMDAGRFARHVEAAYRSMWRSWCQK